VWNEEMHNLLMKLVGEQLRENGTVPGAAWELIALALSAKDWETPGGGTQKHLFTWRACRRRYVAFKGAYTRAHNIHSILTTTFSH
jgi:hypothetical protein